MSSIFVVNFGNVDGVQRYRVNGTLKELREVVRRTTLLGHTFVINPMIEHVRKNEYTVWLELSVPIKDHA